MAGLVPAIHVFAKKKRKTWMPATSAGMTKENYARARPIHAPAAAIAASVSAISAL
jgi:hypothetical protein